MGKYKKLYGTLLLGLIAIIILLTAVFSYSRSIEESYKEENINSLKELSNQGALMLHNEIKNKQNLLAELSHDVSRIFVNDPQAAAAYLEEAAERNSFKRIGVALTDGRAYTTDGVELNISEREYFSKAILGHTAVSRNLDDYTDGGRIAVYAVPIFEDGSDKRIGVLFATYSLDTFRKTIEVSFFGGAGYSYVVQENGDVVVDSQHSESFKNFKNVYAALLTADPVNVSPLSDSVAVKAKKSLSGAGVSVVCGISGVFVGSGILVDSGVFVGSGVLVTSGIVTGFSDGITDTSPDHTESTDPYSSSSNKRKPYLY